MCMCDYMQSSIYVWVKEKYSKCDEFIYDGKVNVKTFQFYYTFIRTLRWWKNVSWTTMDVFCFFLNQNKVRKESIYKERLFTVLSAFFLKLYSTIDRGNDV